MSIATLEPGTQLGTGRGEAVVCLSWSDPGDEAESTLQSVLANTDPEVRVLLCGSGELTLPAEHAPRCAAIASIEAASAAVAPSDIVFVSAGCIVGPGWLEGLRDATYSDSTVATASAIVTSDLDLLEPAAVGVGDAARSVRSRSQRIRPRVSSPRGPCTYFRRSAIELAGELDLMRSSSSGEPVGFALRCIERGLCHVLADDVLVADTGRLRAPPATPPESGPVARAVGAARRAVAGLSVVIDARIEPQRTPGTERHVLELIGALVRTGEARVTAVVSPDGRPRIEQALAGLSSVEITTGEDLAAPVDIVHRPFQVSTPADLAVLGAWGPRLIVTHQDLISYRNPSYFASPDDWEAYRRFTRRALAAADRVLFYTSHGRDDALADELVEPGRTSVVHIGVDHAIGRSQVEATAPAGAERIPDDAELILCLGTNLRHKNRPFALRVVAELQRAHDWSGWLATAGPHVTLGSSAAEERALLDENAQLARAVLDFGAVSEPEKAWLLGRASAVLCPTVYEGFGFVPFEAATRGVPCLWAPGTSLSEILPDAVAGIVPWDPAATADNALALLRDRVARTRNTESVQRAAAGLTWQRTAERLIELYHTTCDEPAATGAVRERGFGLMQDGFSEDAVRLVGPRGALPSDLERPLLALATRPKLAAPLFAAIKVGYRASRRWRQPGRRR